MTPAVVLASGKSSRMGRPKANLPIDGNETFLSLIVRTLRAAEIDDVVVVVGHEAADVIDSFSRTGALARLVENPDYERGQLSSLVRGLNAIDRPGVAAALVTQVDVPFITPATVRAVVERYWRTRAPIVRPVRGDQHGHPVMIDRFLFDEIRRSDPVSGAKRVVRAHASASGDVPVEDEGAFLDVDTLVDYERALARRREPGRL